MEIYVIAIAFTICTFSPPTTHTSEWHDYLKEIIQTFLFRIYRAAVPEDHDVHHELERGGDAAPAPGTGSGRPVHQRSLRRPRLQRSQRGHWIDALLLRGK